MCRNVKGKANLYRSHIRTVEKLENRVRYYERLGKEADERLEEVPLIEAKIVKLREKYQHKFYRKHAVAKISSVIRSFLGIAKGAKDIADAKAHILTLLGD
jgi:hypothetical protein